MPRVSINAEEKDDSAKVHPAPTRQSIAAAARKTIRQSQARTTLHEGGLFSDVKNLSQDPQLAIARTLARKLENQDQVMEELEQLGFNVLLYEEGERDIKAVEFRKKLPAEDKQPFDDFWNLYLSLEEAIQQLRSKRDLMPYDVQNKYWKIDEIDNDGILLPNPVDSTCCPFINKFCAKVAKTEIFEYTTLGVISLNALYFAVDTSWNMPVVHS